MDSPHDARLLFAISFAWREFGTGTQCAPCAGLGRDPISVSSAWHLPWLVGDSFIHFLKSRWECRKGPLDANPYLSSVASFLGPQFPQCAESSESFSTAPLAPQSWEPKRTLGKPVSRLRVLRDPDWALLPATRTLVRECYQTLVAGVSL